MALAQNLTGAEETELALLKLLCTAAEQVWAERLRPGMTSAECGDAFPCAAAFTAAADLLAGRGAGTAVSSFTAGTVSVSERSAGETAAAAKALREEAEGLMAPYVTAEDFAFRGVRG